MHKFYANLLFKIYSIRIKRYQLGKWLELEEIKKSIQTAVDIRDTEQIAHQIVSYISTAIGITIYDNLSWQQTLSLLQDIQDKNQLDNKYPILKSSDGKDVEEVWEYGGRSKYMWINMFAEKYGWLPEYILALDIDTGIALFQEIIMDDQFQKEWEWSLSQNAYSYDEASKSSKYRELPRPVWMRKDLAAEYLEKRKQRPPIPTALMPVGLITSVKH